MKSKFRFWQWQLGGWLLVYAVFTAIIMSNPFATYLESIYGLILFGSACLLTYWVSKGFKRWVRLKNHSLQIVYLLGTSFLVTLLSTCLLVATVFVFSYTGVGYPIPNSQTWIVVNQVFWANGFNVLGVTLLWSCCYFAFTKVRQLIATKELLLESQLKMLDNQLNPHFLFNTINDIRALILEDPKKAREGLAQIADILRFNLQPATDDKITLGEELEVLESYLSLCKIGLEERLDYQLQVSADQGVLIPKLILQLCVENAIKHGIRGSSLGGKLQIVLNQTEQQLQIEVRNPKSVTNRSVPSLGIGVKNIQKRLALLYGNTAAIRVQEQGETVVTAIHLPLEIKKEPLVCA